MSFYFDALEKAIRRHLEPDIHEAIADCDPINLSSRMDSVRVPLRADVCVAYEKGFTRFKLSGTCFRYGRGEYLNVQSYFDTREIFNSSDAAACIEYVFEQAKQRMLMQLADDAFSEMLKEATND